MSISEIPANQLLKCDRCGMEAMDVKHFDSGTFAKEVTRVKIGAGQSYRLDLCDYCSDSFAGWIAGENVNTMPKNHGCSRQEAGFRT